MYFKLYLHIMLCMYVLLVCQVYVHVYTQYTKHIALSQLLYPVKLLTIWDIYVI